MAFVGRLRSSDELEEEGRAMGHCVATCSRLCESVQSSIWSLNVEDASGGVERLLTLEVRNGERRIVQARERSNRPPSAEELGVLARWEDLGSRWSMRSGADGSRCSFLRLRTPGGGRRGRPQKFAQARRVGRFGRRGFCYLGSPPARTR